MSDRSNNSDKDDKHPPSKKIENSIIGVAIAGGSAASATGIVAAGASATGTISAVGAAIGGVAGGVFGSGVGLATGGVGMAATIPFATAGAAIGGWAGPALAVLGIGTAPAWAVPAAIGGGVVAAGGVAVAAYKLVKARSSRNN